jgi:hypothetical protein
MDTKAGRQIRRWRAPAYWNTNEDVMHEFTELTGRQLPAINRALETNKLAALRVVPEEDWQELHAEELP